MPDVYLGLGSNVRPEENLQFAVAELTRRFDLIQVSPVYRNQAVGLEGDEFLNAVARIRTEHSAAELCAQFGEIHDLAGRQRGPDTFVSRTLDIDLLLYGQEVMEERRIPRSDVLEYSFVLGPLTKIAPDLVHPVTGKTMADHWSHFDVGSHPLARDSLILSNGQQ